MHIKKILPLLFLLTGAYGLKAQSNTMQESVFILSEIANDSLSLCSSRQIRLCGSSSETVPEPSYLWSTGDTTACIDLAFTGEKEMLYWCKHPSPTDASAFETDSVWISFLPPYAYLGADTVLCYGKDGLPLPTDTLLTINLGKSNRDSAATYRWFDTDGDLLGEDSVFACTLDMLDEISADHHKGIFLVEVSLSNADEESCTARDTIEIRAIASPFAQYGTNLFIPFDTTLCADRDLALEIPDDFHGYWLNADNTVLPFGADTNRYVFEGKRGTDGFGAGTDTRNPERYYLSYRHRYCPWTGQDTLNLIHLVKPSVVLPSDTIICRNEPVAIEAELPKIHENAYQILWEDGSDLSEREFSEEGIYTVKFGIKEEINTCGYEKAADTISILWVDPAMTDISIPQDTIICVGLTLSLDATVPFDSTLYSWQKGSIPDLEFEDDTIEFTGPVIVIEEEGVYNIRLIDSMGCENRTEINVTIDECQPLLDIPNVFTPNGDGVNDILKFKQLEKCTDVSIQIVNRWGRTVLKEEVKNAEDFQWNGCLHNSNRKLPDGPYFYMVSYKNMYGKKKVQSGSITILGSTDTGY